MCKHKILKHTNQGYVMQCTTCGHIQIAFATTIVTVTCTQFFDYIKVVDELYNRHNLYAFRDEKVVQIPTPTRSVTLVYSVNELKALLQLLVEGRNKMEYEKLFVFNEN